MQAKIKKLPKTSFLMLVLFIGVIASAVSVTYATHMNRKLLNELYNTMSIRDKAQAEYGRLLLEQSTYTSYSRIESLANSQLQMLVPEPNAIQMIPMDDGSVLNSKGGIDDQIN